ncbi:bifunctional [glutamate--ammonia ligase]-adenylyl-L-tyrosine phosphorylase/[glutamate--ammonia-ligase] adenylyltransferase [Paludibacterium paludis]|uniref:Bifunctional glutamine synthetase adenylyltransferase/adenylyl-removing enzyme n=1 Tax=Paludibacterium paludis TaxID=1225769 RepID=A0A918P5W0_9NEIS|nr:bifunctional [glutamate--ammonia ligase]-adenylyl-L-tyrosine phosphorylase/[glutamate--ammonia-ligase] adenylyltransferase [Paludibacterium paludis]GGY23196.1 glutamate-ammonia-ligase adenylyltransferase [Paludibacterium paludis]
MPSIAEDAIAKAGQFSGFLTRRLTASETLRASLLDGTLRPFSAGEMAAFADWRALPGADALAPELRRLREAVFSRLIVRDLAGLATLDEVVTTLSALADFAIRLAVDAAAASLSHYGTPVGEESGEIQSLIVIGMGKLGGNELNASSDIDLVFLYPESGETRGGRGLSNHEYFTQLGKKVIALLDEPTIDGRVFRVDMRLRPYGDSGPLVMSLAALENYLLAQGREWERYAWIKARVITGDASLLTDLVRPFVYRKYLDYGAYGAMRDLHAQIRREVARRDMATNIKLGPGGIREIEFIAQVFQLIRGGRERSLQLRGTRETLERLRELRLLENRAVDELQEAYAFLRALEHRLQYRDDQQTQALPDDGPALLSLAHSLGFADTASFLDALNEQRRRVTRHFEQVFFLPTEGAPDHPLSRLWRDLGETGIADELAQLGYLAPDDVERRLKSLAASQRYQQMAQANRKKFDALIGPLIEVAAAQPDPDPTLARILDLLETISGRASYLALLTEYPQTLQRLAALCSSSAWVAAYLNRHPILLDELLDARVLYAAPDWRALGAQLNDAMLAAGDDVEAQMDTLRHFQHAQTFRLVAQDLAGMWTLEALSDELSALADLVLDRTLEHVWRLLGNRHRDTHRFAVIGYGKLGGKELGYASDLDLIFLYEDDHPDAADVYSRLARRMVAWLTSATSAGVLYDIDLRLRPNGSSGLLVSSLQAFENYQAQTAWVWEHQALTRARFVAGDAGVGQRFEAVRHAVLTQQRDPARLRDEVVAMRERMLKTHPARDSDLKHARGGIVDIEFLVQWLILCHARDVPALTRNSGNIALLGEAAENGLIDPALARAGQDAYRQLRRLQHAARLGGHDRIGAEAAPHYEAGRRLWQDLLATPFTSPGGTV